MPIDSTFLGWDEPYLISTAEFLLERYTPSDDSFFVDCSPAVVTLMGSRASRRLLEVMTFKASELGLSLIPPRFTTVGGLPLLLYPVDSNQLANPATKIFTWIKALQKLPQDKLTTIIPHPPERITDWLAIAKLCAKLFEELSGATLSFSDVATVFSEIEDFLEDKRWEVLSSAFNNYKSLLDDLKLIDRNIYLNEILRNDITPKQCDLDFKEIFLIATSDLDPLLKGLLSKTHLPIHALIHAPESLSENFDEHGCLIAEKWSNSEINIDEDRIKILENPSAQAKEVARLASKTKAASVTVGIADDELTPYVLQALREKGIPARSASGIPITATRPYATLLALSSLIANTSFNNFAEFVRLSDIQNYITQKAEDEKNDLKLAEFFASLDLYQKAHAQGKLRKPLPEAPDEITTVINLIEPLVAAFKDKTPKTLSTWSNEIANFLITIFNEESNDSTITHAAKEIKAVLEQYSDIPSELLVEVSAKDALQIILRALASKQIPLLGETDSSEVLGWLELHPDDAPLLIVTGFNEGFVPESQNNDAFLPDKLRCKLQGLNSNLRRYARDAYVLSALNHDRMLFILAGRRNAAGDPLAISRLLFATDEVTIAKRVTRFYSEELPSTSNINKPQQNFDYSKWISPRPCPLSAPITKLNVTDFASYLNCPYRFYLDKILHLNRYDDRIDELGNDILGSTLHAVLHSFALSDLAVSDDAAKIQNKLETLFDEYVAKTFGDNIIAAAKIQLAQIRFRLAAFAKWQAHHCASGWEIIRSEYPITQIFDTGNHKIELSARIDRIDRNKNDGKFLILDYKTGNKTVDVNKHHMKKDAWIDLQLPLYYYLATNEGSFGVPALGFINISADMKDNCLSMATWDESLINEALECACSVADNIIQAKFWPLNSAPRYDNYKDICGTNCLVDNRDEILGIGGGDE